MEHMIYNSPKEGVKELLFQYQSDLLRGNEGLARNTWNKLVTASRAEDESKLRALRKELYS